MNLHPILDFHHRLVDSVIISCVPLLDVSQDVFEFVEQTRGDIGGFDCELQLSMSYEQVPLHPTKYAKMKVIESFAKRMLERNREITLEQVRLIASDVNGKPSSRTLCPTDSRKPVDQLMFDGSGTELPPIVFYDIIDLPDRTFSIKRGRVTDEPVMRKKFKQLDG